MSLQKSSPEWVSTARPTTRDTPWKKKHTCTETSKPCGVMIRLLIIESHTDIWSNGRPTCQNSGTPHRTKISLILWGFLWKISATFTVIAIAARALTSYSSCTIKPGRNSGSALLNRPSKWHGPTSFNPIPLLNDNKSNVRKSTVSNLSVMWFFLETKKSQQFPVHLFFSCLSYEIKETSSGNQALRNELTFSSHKESKRSNYRHVLPLWLKF